MGIMQCSTHVGLYWGCQYEEAPGQKGVFRVAQDTTVPPGTLLWPRACHTALCDGRRCPWVGPRGVNSGYGHPVPSGQRTPLVSHGVTVGCHRPTRWYNVITPNQRGFMNSSLHWASANKPPVFIISQHFGT